MCVLPGNRYLSYVGGAWRDREVKKSYLFYSTTRFLGCEDYSLKLSKIFTFFKIKKAALKDFYDIRQ